MYKMKKLTKQAQLFNLFMMLTATADFEPKDRNLLFAGAKRLARDLDRTPDIFNYIPGNRFKFESLDVMVDSMKDRIVALHDKHDQEGMKKIRQVLNDACMDLGIHTG